MTQVTALVLRAVASGHRYGFDVMEACGLPSGTVYPALRRLERAKVLQARWEDQDAAHLDGRPARRLYELTEEGRTKLPEAERALVVRQRLLGELLLPATKRKS